MTKTLHPRNKHNSSYDFKKLIEVYPDLKSYVFVNNYGNESVDFANPDAVRALNKALLKHFYKFFSIKYFIWKVFEKSHIKFEIFKDY